MLVQRATREVPASVLKSDSDIDEAAEFEVAVHAFAIYVATHVAFPGADSSTAIDKPRTSVVACPNQESQALAHPEFDLRVHTSTNLWLNSHTNRTTFNKAS